MTYSQLYKVTDTQLVITLPAGFKNKQVLVTIEDKPTAGNNKIAMMEMAAKDPMFLADLRDVNDDFEGIEHETL